MGSLTKEGIVEGEGGELKGVRRPGGVDWRDWDEFVRWMHGWTNGYIQVLAVPDPEQGGGEAVGVSNEDDPTVQPPGTQDWPSRDMHPLR